MLLRAAEALSQAAAAYKAQHGRPFVLIVDGVDRLAVEDTEVCCNVWVCEGVVIFVSLCCFTRVIHFCGYPTAPHYTLFTPPLCTPPLTHTLTPPVRCSKHSKNSAKPGQHSNSSH